MAGIEIKEAKPEDFAGLENGFASEEKILAQAPEPVDQDFEVGEVAVSAEQKADRSAYVTETADLKNIDADTIDIVLANSGNEGMVNEIEAQSSVSGDELGVNSSLELDVDEDSYLAGMNSRAKLLSDVSQEVYQHEKLSHVGSDHSGLVGVAGIEHMDFEMSMPEIHDADDLELAVQRTYEILAEAGVPERELKQAMAAGAKDDNNFAILQEMKEIADEHKVPEAQGYLNLVAQDMETLGIGGKPENAAPALAANDPKFEQSQRMQVSGMRMG